MKHRFEIQPVAVIFVLGVLFAFLVIWWSLPDLSGGFNMNQDWATTRTGELIK